MSKACFNCDSRGSFLYREGQPEDPLLNPRYKCGVCDGGGHSVSEEIIQDAEAIQAWIRER